MLVNDALLVERQIYRRNKCLDVARCFDRYDVRDVFG